MSRSSEFLATVLAFFVVCSFADGGEPHRAVATEDGVWLGGEFYGHDPLGRARRRREARTAAYESPLVEDDDAEFYEADLASYSQPPCDCECNDVCCGEDVCCGDLVCGDACRPRRASRFYADVEYLYGWTKGVDIPALVTTSTAGTLQDDAGVLGLASTSILLGNEEINDGGQSGARFVLGADLGGCRKRRVEFIYSFFEDADEAFAASSDDVGILARPFFNVTGAEQDALLIGFPAVVQGTVGVTATSDFNSFELQCRQHAGCWRGTNVQLLVGYRAADLDDSLVINESRLSLAGATAGSTVDLQDAFSTSNTFQGGQVGLACRLLEGSCWSYDCTVKTALGMTRHKARVAGSTTTTAFGGGMNTVQGGLLTQASNIGDYSSDEFSAVSELGLTLRYRLRRSVSLTFGYNVVFWSDVLRAGEQIDLGVNETQIPPGVLMGEARPAFPNDTTSYWAQEFRFGVQSRF